MAIKRRESEGAQRAHPHKNLLVGTVGHEWRWPIAEWPATALSTSSMTVLSESLVNKTSRSTSKNSRGMDSTP